MEPKEWKSRNEKKAKQKSPEPNKHWKSPNYMDAIQASRCVNKNEMFENPTMIHIE